MSILTYLSFLLECLANRSIEIFWLKIFNDLSVLKFSGIVNIDITNY